MVELMIAVVIVGIVSAIAVPNYLEYVTKSRRVEAKTLLIELAGEQYRYFSENNAYADGLKKLGFPNDSELSENGHYTVSVSAQTASSYTLSAVPVVGSVQAAKDTECATLTINSIGTKGETGTGSVADCW